MAFSTMQGCATLRIQPELPLTLTCPHWTRKHRHTPFCAGLPVQPGISPRGTSRVRAGLKLLTGSFPEISQTYPLPRRPEARTQSPQAANFQHPFSCQALKQALWEGYRVMRKAGNACEISKSTCACHCPGPCKERTPEPSRGAEM